jgi:hypothetical protein
MTSSDGGTDKMQENAEAVATRALRGMAMVVVMQDGERQIVNASVGNANVAAEEVIDALVDAGFSLVRLDEGTRQSMVDAMQHVAVPIAGSFNRALLDAALSVLTDSTKEAGT